MQRLLGIVLLVSLPCVASAANDSRPDWAFPTVDQNAPRPPAAKADDTKPLTVPGSSKSFTAAQLGDAFNVFADWFPEDHPLAPAIVALGKPMVRPCSICHTPVGLGHPESANLAGLTIDYQLRQLAALKSGTRKGGLMNNLAKNLTDEEVQEASAYFASIQPKAWTNVVETKTVPKTYVRFGNMRVPSPDGGTEPIGSRIIEVPDDAQLTADLRDARSGFTAYVPVGSLKKGKGLVAGRGGKTTACAVCHGEDLKGLANVPRIAGRSPVAIAREMFMIKNGDRANIDSELMKPVVAKLTNDDVIAISAYVASLQP